MSDDNEILYFNGLNGDTGRYLFDPTTTDDVARRARGEDDPARVSHWLTGILKRLKGPFQGLPMEVDPNDIAQAGWGIVFAREVSAEVREALEPLIQHRRSQVPEDRCKVLEYESGKGLKDWLKGHGVHVGSVAPTKVPYYLLLIGSPTQIPFSFQCLLDIEYAVGRLHFDDPEAYHHYATSVIRYDTGATTPNAREVAYWGVKHDRATELSADYLISPLYHGDQSSDVKSIAEECSFASSCLLAEDATRGNLLDLFKQRAPAVLCTASHGLGWKMDQVDHQRQVVENGALCTQDWTGEGPLTMDHYVTAQEFGDDLNVHGMVAFLFACFGAGTPDKNHFLRAGNEPEKIAAAPFVSAIPQRLLGHPKGGALAVLGHVDMAWSYSFKPPKIDHQIQPFRNLIGRILKGHPVGNATTDFSERYAALSAELLAQLDRSQQPQEISAKKLARMWIERNDAQNYIMLGDPAARVRVDSFQEGNEDKALTRTTVERAAVVDSRPAGDASEARGETKKSDVARESAPTKRADGVSENAVQEFAAPPQPPAATGSPTMDYQSTSASEAMLFFLGALRALRAHAQTLLEQLELITSVDLRLKESDEQVLQASREVNRVWSECLPKVQSRRATLNTISQQDAVICDWCSDDVTDLEHGWSLVMREWPSESMSPAELQATAFRLQTELHEIIRICGQLTIPGRVNDHLVALRIGQAFDFHKSFQDELPNQEDRGKVLQFMADHPNIVTGIVDVDAGTIYRASTSHRRRLLSYFGVMLFAVAGFGLIGLIDQTNIWRAAGTELRFPELGNAYIFLLLGAVSHVLVGAIKQTRQRASAGLVALEDWLLWCHVRETSLVLSIVYLWIGVVGMAFLFEPPIPWHTAFFVGYSIDSFVDIFLGKFSARAESELASLRSNV